MIGHNLDEINALVKEIEGAYVSLGSTLVEGWGPVTKTLQTEWIGPDESSFEERLAKQVVDLYIASKQNFLDMATNINNIGQGWIDFQNKNIVTDAAAGNLTHTFETPNLDEYDVVSAIKATPFVPNGFQNLGIANGETSATTINSSLDTYITSIKDKLSQLGTGLSASAAFLGGSQSETIEGYMQAVTTYVGGLMGLVSELQPILTQLVKNYNEQASAFTQSVKTASQDLAASTPTSTNGQ